MMEALVFLVIWLAPAIIIHLIFFKALKMSPAELFIHDRALSILTLIPVANILMLLIIISIILEDMQRKKFNSRKLRSSIEKAYTLQNAIDSQLQIIERQFIYKGFLDEDLPSASMCTGGELILEYHGSEIFVEEAVKLMELYGYISPNDFA